MFPEATLDRDRVRWEDHLEDLTPVELRLGGVQYKREDYFAPLGYGGINGSKLRQLLYLVTRYRREGGEGGILTGASVLSPQVSMSALVGRHFEMPVEIVLGATNRLSAAKHENVAIANRVGANFRYAPVAYNPALQRAVLEAAADPLMAGWYRLCYGITTPEEGTPFDVREFHAVGARQVANIPAEVKTIVMTAGSCNSCTSVLYGLTCYPTNVERVVLLGVGPTRLEWIEDRLMAIEDATGVGVRGRFRRRYHHHSAAELDHQTDGAILLEHYDLHSTKFATYQDKMPYTLDEIEFHPTYEGKALEYMQRHRREFQWFWESAGDVLFWIVGSAPSLRAMSNALLLDGV